jgi:hypothetical protein
MSHAKDGAGNRIRTGELPPSPAAIAALHSLPRAIKGGKICAAWKRSDIFTKSPDRITNISTARAAH